MAVGVNLKLEDYLHLLQESCINLQTLYLTIQDYEILSSIYPSQYKSTKLSRPIIDGDAFRKTCMKIRFFQEKIFNILFIVLKDFNMPSESIKSFVSSFIALQPSSSIVSRIDFYCTSILKASY